MTVLHMALSPMTFAKQNLAVSGCRGTFMSLKMPVYFLYTVTISLCPVDNPGNKLVEPMLLKCIHVVWL